MEGAHVMRILILLGLLLAACGNVVVERRTIVEVAGSPAVGHPLVAAMTAITEPLNIFAGTPTRQNTRETYRETRKCANNNYVFRKPSCVPDRTYRYEDRVQYGHPSKRYRRGYGHYW
ncbi:MAG TPA: hypothetical protein VGA06_02015 [Candidatus Paceibacterota bacterium]